MTITLDDAIAHALEKAAEEHACGDEHDQLAEWLIELKARRGLDKRGQDDTEKRNRLL